MHLAGREAAIPAVGEVERATIVVGEIIASLASAGPDADARSIGRRLNIAYVLSGSLQRQGEAVSIAVKLQSAATGALLWSERFDYGEQAGWNWRRDITARIANELKVCIDEAGDAL